MCSDKSIMYFTVFFFDNKSNFNVNNFCKVCERSLSSAVNLTDVLYFVCNSELPRDVMTRFEGFKKLSIIQEHIEGFDQNSWVVKMQLLKNRFVARNKNRNLVYVELDMLFRKGCKDYIEHIFSNYNFHIAYTFRPSNLYYCGSTNTGIILFKNIDDNTIDFKEAILHETIKIIKQNGKCDGGENQYAVDNLGAKYIPNFTTRRCKNIDILSLPMKNINSLVCMMNTWDKDTFILHFNGKSKENMFNIPNDYIFGK